MQKRQKEHAVSSENITLQEENFHYYILIFAVMQIENSLNLNSAYYYVFRNLSMIAYTIEIQT